MTSPATFRRRRFVSIALVLILLAAVALGVKLAVDLAAGPATAVPGGAGNGGELTAADGLIGDGERVTVFDTDVPAVANLDPALLEAVQHAASDAAATDDIPFLVTSGWRSPALQQKMFADAVHLYASEEEAARWVATPETSLHVSGDAIDLGPFDATYWLSLHGAAYGLCQIYANETWHFELRPDAETVGCPDQYLDPTYDPRLQGSGGQG